MIDVSEREPKAGRMKRRMGAERLAWATSMSQEGQIWLNHSESVKKSACRCRWMRRRPPTRWPRPPLARLEWIPGRGPGKFDVVIWGDLFAAAIQRGRPRPVNDTWVAACCLAYGIPLATLNLKDFADFAGHDGLSLIAK
jgi:hypothetical protein